MTILPASRMTQANLDRVIAVAQARIVDGYCPVAYARTLHEIARDVTEQLERGTVAGQGIADRARWITRLAIVVARYTVVR